MWILVAESSQAKVFFSEGKGKPIQLIKEFSHPRSRIRELQIASDKPGRTFDSYGTGRHAKAQEVAPHQAEIKEFAHEISEYLKTERGKNAFHHLYVAAPPQFLGELRDTFSDNVKKSITKSINKDYGNWMSKHELEKHIRQDFDL